MSILNSGVSNLKMSAITCEGFSDLTEEWAEICRLSENRVIKRQLDSVIKSRNTLFCLIKQLVK